MDLGVVYDYIVFVVKKKKATMYCIVLYTVVTRVRKIVGSMCKMSKLLKLSLWFIKIMCFSLIEIIFFFSCTRTVIMF